jgi:hypothetical protein
MTATNELHIYDLLKNSWLDVSTSGTPPSPRFSHSATIINGKLYLNYFNTSTLLCVGSRSSPKHVIHIKSLRLYPWHFNLNIN